MALDFAEFVDDDAPPPQDKLDRLRGLVTLLDDTDTAIATKTEELEALKTKRRKTAEEDIPGLLEELRLSELRLPDGTKVVVGEVVRPPSMGADSKWRAPMIAWLSKHGLDDVVKDTLAIPFGKGEGPKANELAKLLGEKGYEFSRGRTVNAQTLAKLIRELRAQTGDDRIAIPYADLGIQVAKFTNLEDRPKSGETK